MMYSTQCVVNAVKVGCKVVKKTAVTYVLAYGKSRKEKVSYKEKYDEKEEDIIVFNFLQNVSSSFPQAVPCSSSSSAYYHKALPALVNFWAEQASSGRDQVKPSTSKEIAK